MLIGSIIPLQAPYLKSFLFARSSEKSFSAPKFHFNQHKKAAKARLPTFSHNLHLAVHHILLILSNILQITTCRLFDSIQFLCCIITRNTPHFFMSTSAIPVNRCLTKWISSVKPRLLPDKLSFLTTCP